MDSSVTKTMRLLFIWFSMLIAAPAFAQVDEQQAEEIVKTAICIDDQTIAEVLKSKLKKRSQRDLGWKVFKDEGNYDVERAIMISKSMKIRYRWRVNGEGAVEPVSKRAKKLCSGD